jgi:hypothetical protein
VRIAPNTCIYDEESNKELGIFTFLLKIQNELKKVGNFHQTLESKKLVKIGKKSFLLQIQKYMTKFWKLLLQIQEILTQNWKTNPNF